MTNTAAPARTLAAVVENGMCIGCGLCEAAGGGGVSMTMTGDGRLRPFPADGLSPHQEVLALAACPGTGVEPRNPDKLAVDPVWGGFSTMRHAWAGDADVRFRASTGGALTALGQHLLRSGRVDFIYHVAADPDRPVRSVWTISETPQKVLDGAGPRYGPVAPLAGFLKALDRGRPFAIIAKPCDLSAVHRLAARDPRVDALCLFRLAMVCGGQSRLGKSLDLLQELGIEEDDVTLFRHRGHGNPGPTRIETRDGRAVEKTYRDLWLDEAGWQLETRCKLCPDALGEAADIAAADVWPGGSPVGEDEGFNGVIIRTGAGEDLFRSALAAGDLVAGEAIAPREFDGLQPHQVRKKQALKARLDALAEAGMPGLRTSGLRIEALAEEAGYEREFQGTLTRIREGRFREDTDGPTDGP